MAAQLLGEARASEAAHDLADADQAGTGLVCFGADKAGTGGVTAGGLKGDRELGGNVGEGRAGGEVELAQVTHCMCVNECVRQVQVPSMGFVVQYLIHLQLLQVNYH